MKDNEEVKYYQPKFKRWINSDKWDLIAEKLSDVHMSIIKQVMNAKKDGDCSWLVWHQCDNVLNRIKEVASKMR